MTTPLSPRAGFVEGDGAASSRRPWLGLAITVSVLTLLIAPELVGGGSGDEREWGILIAVALVGLISGLLVSRRPDHPISWLLTAGALAGGVAGLAAASLPPGLTDPSWWQLLLALVSGPAWYGLLFSVLVLIPLLFPTGSPPSPWWRWVGWLGGSALVVMSALWLGQETFCTEWNDAGACLSKLGNPLGVPGVANPEESMPGTVAFGAVIVAVVGALASQVVRYRRASSVERRQIKWVAFSLGLFITSTLLIGFVWIDMIGRPAPVGYELVSQLLWVLIPISIAVAILRYRLYEIDRIISRTVAYGILAILLGLVYAGGVIGLQALMSGSDDLAVAASTLVVAALFSPLRRRLQRGVDRRFNRRRYDALRVADGFAESMRQAAESSVITAELVTVVARTLEPRELAVWLSPAPGRPTMAMTHPTIPQISGRGSGRFA